LVHSGPVALSELRSAVLAGRLCEQSANVAAIPLWCANACVCTFHDAM
jgi:hypothetical protein